MYFPNEESRNRDWKPVTQGNVAGGWVIDLRSNTDLAKYFPGKHQPGLD